MALLAYFCSHFWLATPQEVLQADWQEVWHSPQPPFFALWHKLLVSRVWMWFIMTPPFNRNISMGSFYQINSRKSILFPGLEGIPLYFTTGKEAVMARVCSSGLSARIFPRWAVTMPLAMARPRP